MRKFIIGIILMTFVLGACTNTTKKQQAVTQAQGKNSKEINTDKFVEKLLAGTETLTGTSCNKELKVEIKITGLKPGGMIDGSELRIYGIFYAVGPQGKVLETNLRGIYFSKVNELRLWGDNAPTLDKFVRDYFGGGLFNSGRRAFEEAKKGKDFQKFMEKYEPYIQSSDKRFIPEIPLAIDLIRDSGEKGWIGAFEGRRFKDCREIILAGENGTATGKLPLLTENEAKRIVGNVGGPDGSKGRTDINRLYWLSLAAEIGGSFETVSRIDRILQNQGKTSSQDYQKVVKYYQSLAKDGDQRAQRELANIFTEGRGTTVNLAEAKKWRDLSDATLKKAAEVCGSKKTIAAIYAIFKKEDEEGRIAEVVGSIVTGMSMKVGDIKVTEVVAEEVDSMDKQFICAVYGERVGAGFDASTVPDVEYFAKDGYGKVTYIGNNSDKKAFLGGLANFINNELEKPYKREFEIKPLGEMRYTLESGKYQATLDLDLQPKKINNAPLPKKELPDQKEQQIEQNPKIDDWAKDYFNKQ